MEKKYDIKQFLAAKVNELQYDKINKGSHVASFEPCEGTRVKTNRKNADGTKEYQLSAYKVNKAPKGINSTKIGNNGDVAWGKIYRKGKFQPQMLTVLLVMRMTIAKRMKAGVTIDSFPRELRKVKKI